MKKLWISLLLVALLLAGCASSGPKEREMTAMDTLITIRLWGSDEDLDAAENEISRLDGMLSATDPDSPVYQLNQTGRGDLPAEAADLLEKAAEVSVVTGGSFDPTVYPYVKAWGFTREEKQVPTDDMLETLKPSVGTEHIHQDGESVILDAGTELDLGGIAKGYAAQRCADLLKSRGVESAILSLGGNVQTIGNKPDKTLWAVGIADPDNPASPAAVLHFEGAMALVTSGSYQRYFEKDGIRYHHILDPKTGCPADNGLASVTILTDDGTTADGFSTALFVMGMEKATEFWKARNDFEAVFMTTDGSIYATEGAAPLLSDCEFTVIER